MPKSKTSPRGKVLFVGHEATRTGAPLVLLHFLRWLRRNSDLEFEVLLRQDGEILEDFQQLAHTCVQHRGLVANGKVTFVRKLRRKYGINPPLEQQLRQLYPREIFPLVYSNTITNGEVVSIFSRLGHRTLCHAHEMRFTIETFGGPHAARAAKVTDGFIAASAGVGHALQETLNVPSDKISVIHPFGQPSGFTPAGQAAARQKIRAALGISDSDVVVGMCGYTNWRKGCDLFLLVAKRVAELKPARRHVFLWIGVDEDAPEYRQMAHDRLKLGLKDTVRLIPAVSNPQDYFSALDIFTLTSREDAFPMVTLEAASLGIPVVCFADTGGTQELVGSDGGQVVPYLDILMNLRLRAPIPTTRSCASIRRE